jgi:hypothetical protein
MIAPRKSLAQAIASDAAHAIFQSDRLLRTKNADG